MKRLPLRVLCLLLAAVLSPRPAAAQSAAASDAQVQRAAMDYIEGFYEGDTVKLVRSIRPEVYKYGFSYSSNAKAYQGEQMTWSEILSYAKSVKARGRPTPATAPKKVELLEVLDQTAAAKVTAWWGTDYLLLGRFDGKWMITHVLWQSPPPRSSH